MNPKHINPRTEMRTARAPYNFVPLPEAIVSANELPRHDRYETGRYTGSVRCILTTETPLYTRAALEPDEYGVIEAKNKPDFFYVNPTTHEPVIPGSSLRGMLRNLVEIVTYGKLQPVTAQQLFFRTLDDTSIGKAYGGRMSGEKPRLGWYPIASAGYVERRGFDYYIRPAQEIKGTQHYRVEEELARAAIPHLREMAFFNQRTERWSPNKRSYEWKRIPVWFKPVAPISHLPKSYTFFAEVTELSIAHAQPGPEWVRGCLIASGWVPSRNGPGKHRHWIVGPPIKDDSKLILLNDIDVEAYREEGAGLSKDIKDRKMSVLPQQKGEQVACFYTYWKDSEGRERIAFGHTGMFRLPYELSPRDLLADYLKDASVTDVAEALFGWVDTQSGRQIAGRVYVGDACLVDGQTDIFVLTPQEKPIRALLSGPKPTTFQHYLTQRTDVKNALHHYADKGITTLRGHKLYWHKDKRLHKEDYHDAEWTPDSTQHTSLRPVAADVAFAFDLRFENLTASELGALLWVLKVGGEGQHRLKLGMGKPLGLGTVRLESALTLSNRYRRYGSFQAEWAEPADAIKEFDKAFQAEVWERLPEKSRLNAASLEEAFVVAFEEHIWTALPPEAKGDAMNFRSLPRVQMLLKLLEWPGLNRDLTRYQTIEPNEYRQRPVLPDPLAIAGQPVQPPISAPQVNAQTRSESATPSAPQLLRPPQSAPPTGSGFKIPSLQPNVPPPSVPKAQPIREATVVSPEGSFVIVELDGVQINIQLDDLVDPGRNLRDRQRLYPKGSKIRVRDLGLSSKGKRRLTTKL